jgi:hypothetical protein
VYSSTRADEGGQKALTENESPKSNYIIYSLIVFVNNGVKVGRCGK